MNSVLPYLINWLQQFGYPALWLAVFVASAGVPLPIVLVLLAAGAFAALGDFNLVILAITATSAAVCGDSVGYWIGRWWGFHRRLSHVHEHILGVVEDGPSF